ncbi:hypothetical protein FE783_28205 [Paenibacillus mesophilus]|uniref:hypothetical protein n=1 Tax=Paenibacillus mesophilus TaxID=2582849 RepID=UPI00110EC633|nr:hypothetical protein [Paenibacillus mesophilus]TMV45815.1 hypothetical protein FE783_28205 [Paenibacillus mesophilus]
MNSPSYNTAIRLRAAAFALMLALAAVVCFKLYNSYTKVRHFAEAKRSYENRNWIQAEIYFNKTASNRWLSYKEETTSLILAELKPVTEIKEMMQDIRNRAEEADKKNDIQSLLAVYGEYGEKKAQATAGGENNAALFAEMSALDNVEAELSGAMQRAAEQAAKELQAGMKKRVFQDEAAVVWLQLPPAYIGSEQKRNEEIRAKLEPYDQARIEALNAGKGLAELMAEGARLNKLYQQYGFRPDWLYPIIEQTVQNRLAALLEKNDWTAFAQNAKLYEQSKEWPVAGSPTAKYIQDSYNKQLAAAEQLSAQQRFAEAIALYEKLAAYRDTRAAIRAVELAWSTAQPEHLLQKAMPGTAFTNVIAGKSQFGAVAYAAGIAGSKLVLAKLMADMTVDKKETDLGPGVRITELRTIESLGVQGMPTLLVQAASTARKSRYIAYDAVQTGLRKLFDFEADGYQQEGQGVLVVDNDNGKGAGQKSYYEYRNGEYAFSKIKPDYVDIALASLKNYKNVKVRFQCTIIAVDDNVAVVMHDGQYILLGGMKLKTGSAVITGTWSEYEEIKKGATSIPAMKVNVVAAQQ